MTKWHPVSAKVGTDFTDKRRSLGIVRSQAQATEFSLVLVDFHETLNERYASREHPIAVLLSFLTSLTITIWRMSEVVRREWHHIAVSLKAPK
jgi:hypothetical protein